MAMVLCQRCKGERFHWTIRAARFDIGRISNWTVQLCEECTDVVVVALGKALSDDAVDPAVARGAEPSTRA